MWDPTTPDSTGRLHVSSTRRGGRCSGETNRHSRCCVSYSSTPCDSNRSTPCGSHRSCSASCCDGRLSCGTNHNSYGCCDRRGARDDGGACNCRSTARSCHGGVSREARSCHGGIGREARSCYRGIGREASSCHGGISGPSSGGDGWDCRRGTVHHGGACDCHGCHCRRAAGSCYGGIGREARSCHGGIGCPSSGGDSWDCRGGTVRHGGACGSC